MLLCVDSTNMFLVWVLSVYMPKFLAFYAYFIPALLVIEPVGVDIGLLDCALGDSTVGYKRAGKLNN